MSQTHAFQVHGAAMDIFGDAENTTLVEQAEHHLLVTRRVGSWIQTRSQLTSATHP